MRNGLDKDEFVGVNGEIIGFHLSADHCAEHEWGIKGILHSLGVLKEGYGIDRRTITNSDEIAFMKFSKLAGKAKGKKMTPCAVITNYKQLYSEEPTAKWVDGIVGSHRYSEGDKCTAGAWDENNFMFVVRGQDQVDALQMVYDAFLAHDIAVFLGGAAAFKNAGVSFAIKSRFPADIAKQMSDNDQSTDRLMLAFKETGIEELLAKAGKKYFALSPRWADDDEKELTYWLNPMEQQQNNYGWFKLRDLQLWAENGGPIPMKKGV